MKKILALVLVLTLVAALFVGCAGETKPSGNDSKPADTQNAEPGKSNNPDDIPDTMTSSDGKYEVAFVTDVGSLKDKSFNQGTYDGVKLFASANNKSYKYYQPANASDATDEDRFEAMKAACDNGAKVVVCAGFMQGTALAQAAEAYPDVKFVFIDGWSLGKDNVAGIVFHEEQCGYLAGYAAVKEGYTKLGFTGGGGGTNDAVNRYGYGYVQGASDAAKELGTKVEMNYTFLYGGNFQPSAELQTLCAGWYENGTEVIFSCGGSIFDSVTSAADAAGKKVIGVDVDQSYTSKTVITSALKGIGEAAQQALEAAFGVKGDWGEWSGANCKNLGAAEGSVGLPVDTWSLKNWSVDDYKAMFDKIVKGEIVIDADFSKVASTDYVDLKIVE